MTRKEAIQTTCMLDQLTILLRNSADENQNRLQAREDAESLRRISMTLHRWHELECGVDNGGIERDERWAIERAAHPASDHARWWDGAKWVKKCNRRTYDDSEKSAMSFDDRERNGFPIDGAWRDTGGAAWWYSSHSGKRTHIVADREAGALKRLAVIMSRYPSLTSYVQGDPRGCALYILRPGDVPAGCDVGAYYSRGLAVHS